MTEEQLIKDFNSEIEQAFSSAYHSSKGGDANWNKVLESYGITPLTDDVKQALINSQMKISTGAFPVELRRVYEKVVEKYTSVSGGSQKVLGVVSSFNTETKVIEYYQKIKPFGGINDIFKNAASGNAKYSQGLQKEKQMTIKCKSCGAPRLEEMQYDTCMFCGSKLFEKVN